ncbi:hypothetical protein [uncultured Corynebacterium sp.]|nr:hypothetical protein [uncultured Corynebacterium sp.]
MKKALSSPLLPLLLVGLATVSGTIHLAASMNSGGIVPYYHVDLDVY